MKTTLNVPALTLALALTGAALAQGSPTTTQTTSTAAAPSSAEAAAAALAALTPAQAAERAQTLAAQGRALPKNAWNIDTSPWKEAAAAAERAVQGEPTNTAYLRLRATIYSDVGFWRQAERAWDAYFAAGGSGDADVARAAEAQYNLGYAAYTRGSLNEAGTAFAKCLSLAPTNAQCAQWAGRVALENGQFAEATRLYEVAVKAAPNDKVSAYFLGVSRNAAKYGPAATRAFTRAYQQYDAGKKAEALALYGEAAASAPNFVEALREGGRVALELGDAAAAVRSYEALTKLPGATASDTYNLGVAREGAQYGLGAVQAFRGAYARYTAGDKAAAEAGFLTATRANAKYAKAWAWLGRVRYEAKNYAGAADAYAQAVQLDPNDKTSAYYLKLARAGK
ncbi:tetratricopeptide repeat protein [Deinococcus maricopensis]|nr:tetratricopeptide repeat protein [Deinococcus maricopensis]